MTNPLVRFALINLLMVSLLGCAAISSQTTTEGVTPLSGTGKALKEKVAKFNRDEWLSLGIEFDRAGQFSDARLALKMSADLGHPEAAYHFAYYLEIGLGGIRNIEEAINWYKASADNGFADAYYSLGRLYMSGAIAPVSVNEFVYLLPPNEFEAIYWLEQASNNDIGNAQMMLASAYFNGVGVRADHKTAFEYYEKAAQKNIPVAMYSLAFSYEYGLGTKVNLDRAFRWYLKAAYNNYSWAQFALGRFFELGYLGETSFEDAYYWYALAEEQGNREASDKANLMWALIKQSEDDSDSLESMVKKAKEGGAQEQMSLALKYEAVYHDFDSAAYWMQKAAENGSNRAMYYLGQYYIEGLGVEQDLTKSVMHLLKAVETGVTDALNDLAWVLATAPDDNIFHGENALKFAKLAVNQYSCKKPYCLDTLAAAYAASGQYNQAVLVQQRAISLEESVNQDDAVISRMQNRLGYYMQRLPWRKPLGY